MEKPQSHFILPHSTSSELSDSSPESMTSVTLGRALSSLLSARPKKLHDAVSRLSPDSTASSVSASLDDSLRFLHNYLNDAARRNQPLDEVIIPMLDHWLRNKDSKHGGQAMVVLNWLFQEELIFRAVAAALVRVLSTKDDRFVVLGWCTFVRAVLEYESCVTQFSMTGIKERYPDLLKILTSCILQLLVVMQKGSTLQDGYELPSRLAVSAADCFLALSEALIRKGNVPSSKAKLSDSKAQKRPVTLLSVDGGDKKTKLAPASNMELDYVLWDHLEEVLGLVQKLLAWSRKSRPLHSKGLEQVLKWLQEIKEHYQNVKAEAGSKVIKTGIVLLSSCWKHYGMLMHLEDQKFSQHYKELLDQYLAGIQFYAGQTENKDGSAETIKFFLNCLFLLLGRFDSKKFESVVSEYGMRISQVLLPQLHSAADDVIDGVLGIFKVLIFKQKSPGSSLTDTGEVDAVLPLLIHLLDERDGTARAVVLLIAEYCLMSRDSQCIEEVIERLASANLQQRRNAVDVISKVIHLSSDSKNVHSQLPWQDIAKQCLLLLEDEDIAIREKVSSLLPLIDPLLVLPALVNLIYSGNERMQSTASDACVVVLKHHSQNAEVICMLLDCLSNLSQSVNLNSIGDTVPKLESDRVLRLIPEWSKSVQSWNFLIEPLIDKMFAEPSNANIVRFLSHISEHLAEASDVVISCVLKHVKRRKEMDDSSLSGLECQTYNNDDSGKLQQTLFEHLCPLLVIKMLPLRVFNDLDSTVMYGRLSNQEIIHDCRDINAINQDSVTALLLRRTFCQFEFNDVRKLAAELCGRIHPQVLVPLLCSQLEYAAGSQDIIKIKACLFAICTSLVVRGRESLSQPGMLKIRKTLETMLLWPSLDGDEVSKAQHGCIDCMAIMICAELQDPVSSNVGTKVGDAVLRNSVIMYVINQLTQEKDIRVSKSNLDDVTEVPIPLSFYLCMANVLISACQKMSDSGKKPFARRSLPRLIRATEVITKSQIRAACTQVLFSAVYHLKSIVLPYSMDLLKVSLKALQKGSEKERMVGAKLLGSLMASDDAIVQSISPGLMEARSVLSSLSSTDASPELRQVSRKLLACLTS
ncbi:uncharacterized protein LOC126785487 [Argentina anserina]|uniref:uncharacterized protein LOC126785487 n=1 Tax=Argentina anserina TaxID=57926 RepID=UPI0021762B88|nr:uncharacterized protein LOC126785487 [Potentilla anserina]